MATITWRKHANGKRPRDILLSWQRRAGNGQDSLPTVAGEQDAVPRRPDGHVRGDAETRFRKIRWAETDGEPVCPFCGSLDPDELKGYQQVKCADKGCRKLFSVTLGHAVRQPQDIAVQEP
jgi:hypothetical protein